MSDDTSPPRSNVISLFGHKGSPAPPPQVELPGLRPLPPPPALSDPRQANSRGLLSNLQRQLGPGVAAVPTNFETGMAAAELRLCILQDLLEGMLADFDMKTLPLAWEDTVSPALREAIQVWVQRTTRLQLELRDNGVHIWMQTQDDRGYYSYRFDVFPGRPPMAT